MRAVRPDDRAAMTMLPSYQWFPVMRCADGRCGLCRYCNYVRQEAAKPLWVYPEGLEPEWLDMSGASDDHGST